MPTQVLTFIDEDLQETWGIVRGDSVIRYSDIDPGLPPTVAEALRLGHLDWRRLTGPPAGDGSLTPIPMERITLLPPVPRPGKIICVGRNYAAHIAETGAYGLHRTERPSLFLKAPSTAIGCHGSIPIPSTSSQLDYEVELAVIIGRLGKHIHPDAALEYIAGYTIFNDLSIRDIQFDPLNGSNTVGKNFDGSSAFGPWLTLADAVPDPQVLGLRAYVNDELRQSDNTSGMIFTVANIISFVSQQMTLEPGDVISTGTPAGSAFSEKEPRWLAAGDRVRLEIDCLGSLENEVVG
jgi:acylpyruvate hydrolase